MDEYQLDETEKAIIAHIQAEIQAYQLAVQKVMNAIITYRKLEPGAWNLVGETLKRVEIIPAEKVNP